MKVAIVGSGISGLAAAHTLAREMVEAVGREYWPQYFLTVHRLLKPGGRACIQSIVIDDALWDRYIDPTDFIQQYIFPGGCLPCPREFGREAAAAGFDVVDEMASAPTTPRHCGAGATASWGTEARSCNLDSTQGSSAYGSSISPAAKRPSTRPTSTWCSTRWSSASARWCAAAPTCGQLAQAGLLSMKLWRCISFSCSFDRLG